MKKHSIFSRILAFMLTVAMVLPSMPVNVSAAVGDLSNVDTGLTSDIDTKDTISLPIKILDYEADGMMFEYAESYSPKDAEDFNATWYEDYTTLTEVGGSINTGNYWSDVKLALKTGTYANYTRMTWAENTTANWTGNRAGIVMADFTTSSTYTTDQIRYMVVVFRSNVRSGNFTVGLNRANLNGAGTDGNYTGNIAVTTENNTNWTYAVLDLKTGTLGSNWSKGAVHGVYVGLPIDASGEWMDLAHVAFFSNKDQATAFGEYALTDGSNRGDNRGFGLLRGSRNEGDNGTTDNGRGSAFNGIYKYGDAQNTVYQMDTFNNEAPLDYADVTKLGYTLLGEFRDNGIANIGLLESSLSEKGYPVYKEEVVTYIAELLKFSLELPEMTDDGWRNYRYVRGTKSSIYDGTDLATALRKRINNNMGDYSTASKKNLVGTWSEVNGNIASYYDAAYFLLNSIFVPGSYNVVQDDYDYLILSAGETTASDESENEKVYVFDGGFTTSATPDSASIAVKYDTDKNTIQNSSAAGKTHFVYEGTATTTLNPFLPVTDRNNEDGQTINPYEQDDGVINSLNKQVGMASLYQRNFNFAMVSEGEFVYHADDELFFDFEGDDDVYLFINNELVMDIGSAHSIDSVRFELNDYVNAAKAGKLGSSARNAALALEEGNTYPFKFYYMERHSYGSNIRIMTNIRVTDPSMVTAKTAWQDGVQLDFGSIVDKDKVVEYGFAITNNGEENLYNLTFADNDIGVTLDPTNGLKVTGSRVYDAKGGVLEAKDLTAIVTHPDYDDIEVTFADNNALKAFLASLSSDSVIEDGGGLWIGSTVLIRGIGYKLSEAQINAGVFDNTVLTTATNKTESETLQGQATMRVFVPADPMYYEWAGHDLFVTKTKLITDVLAAAKTEGNILAGKVPNLTTSNVNKIELTTKAGTAITSPYVTIDGSYNLTINYKYPGSNVFYLKVTYNSSKNTVIVPVLVNVTNVKDSVFVLDYGLEAPLTDNGELYKNDFLTVPGRSTDSDLLGILVEGGDYSPNEITLKGTLKNSGEIVGNDGKFTINGENLSYLPTTFMEAVESVYAVINVYESDITPSKVTGTLDINNEVEMYKKVMVLPATVVYYEDTFITYTAGTAENSPNTFGQIGTTNGLTQSVDQEQAYGQDKTYQDSDNTIMSAGTLSTITIKGYESVATFTFNGTGFELIARTNAKDSANIIVKVVDTTKKPTDEGYVVKNIPVITQFDNGKNNGGDVIYQVPVVSVKDLPFGRYEVQISGVPSIDHNSEEKTVIPTYLYVDGLRIYQPMDATNDYYTDKENGATFVEIRDLILANKVGAVEYDVENEALSVITPTMTWTENLNGTDYTGKNQYVGNVVESLEDYLTLGPNNEVYMNGDEEYAALVFYVDEQGEGVHNLQIAVHAIDEGLFYGSDSTGAAATVIYGVKADGDDAIYQWKYLNTGNLLEEDDSIVNVASGTEQYYEIPYKECPYIDGKGYQVAIAVYGGMASFTKIKYNGLELATMDGKATTLYYDNGILMDSANQVAVLAADYMDFAAVGYQMRSTQIVEPEEEVEDTISPDVPEIIVPETPAVGFINKENSVRNEFLVKYNNVRNELIGEMLSSVDLK